MVLFSALIGFVTGVKPRLTLLSSRNRHEYVPRIR